MFGLSRRDDAAARSNHRRRVLAFEPLEVRTLLTTLPNGFTETQVVDGLAGPTAMEIAPDGRIFVAEQTGALRVVKNGALLPTPFVSLNVNSDGERGLLGVAFDPNFATNPFVYVYYTVPSSPRHNRVSRFTASGDAAVSGSEQVLLDIDSLSIATNHNGGAIHFGSDGKLYIGVGENASPPNSQSLGNLLGKVLRINSDGSIPSDNPFFNTVGGKNRAIWALGLRNPFTFAVQPGTGRVFINDVGQGTWEEIDDGIAGSNYGWPNSEGFKQAGDPATSIGTYRDPLTEYAHGGDDTTGCAITGGTFYNPTVAQFGNDFVGDYFFADLCNDWIRRFDSAANTVTAFATGVASSIVDLKVDPAGSLYYLSIGTGTLNRIEFPTGNQPPMITEQPADQTALIGDPVTFTASATGTLPLSYQWQRDGVDIPDATSPSYSIDAATLADNGATFRVIVTNSIDIATSDDATLTVTNNTRPVPSIDTPDVGSHYNAGDTIDFSGSAMDAEDIDLPASAFSWRIVFHHADHTHPFLQPMTGITSGQFTIPNVGETSADVFYRIHLTVIDSGGATKEVTRDVLPNTSMVTLATSPPGLQLRLDGQPIAAGSTVESVVGMMRTLGVVSPQLVAGVWYEFQSWSDAGNASHEVATPAIDTMFTATFSTVASPEITGVRLGGKSKLTQITLSFNKPLDPAAATNPVNYRLVNAGKDRRFNSAAAPSSDDAPVLFETPVYAEPAAGPASTVTLTLRLPRGVSLNTFVRISLDGTIAFAGDHAITSTTGAVLDGEFRGTVPTGDGIAGGDFIAIVALGRNFDYSDRDGDSILLNLTKGLAEFVRESPLDGIRAEGLTLRLRDTSSKSELTGKVTRRGGDGRTSLLSITGAAGIRNRLAGNPAFTVGSIAAVVVDRVLESNPLCAPCASA